MTCIFFSNMFTSEDVSKVSTAVDALNFRSLSVGVWQTFYCTRNFIVKAWPTTVCFKLVL